MRHGMTLGLVLACGLLATGAAAQPAPSVQQMIEGLDPESPLRRGIRMPGPPPAEPPAGAPPALTITSAPPGIAAIALTVNFATGSAALTPSATRLLADLALALASPQLAGFRFRIEGHTDSVGAPALNQALSERRAAAVRAYLVSRQGIAPARLEAVGLGEQSLLVPTPDETAEPRNRRVQILNLGP